MSIRSASVIFLSGLNMSLYGPDDSCSYVYPSFLSFSYWLTYETVMPIEPMVDISRAYTLLVAAAARYAAERLMSCITAIVGMPALRRARAISSPAAAEPPLELMSTRIALMLGDVFTISSA